MNKKYLVTQNNESSFFDTIEEAQTTMTYEDSELWEQDSSGCYIKLFLQ
jgi:hypothetical protein